MPGVKASWLFCFLLLFLFVDLYSQSTVYTSGLDSIIITVQRENKPVSKSEFSIHKLNTKQISNITNLFSISEALNSVPGIVANDRANISQGDKISVRGMGSRAMFGVRGSKILLDGIPLTFPDGQSQLNNLDVGQIESIEIINGPASVLHGNASGGVILFNSKTAQSPSYATDLEFKIGGYGAQKISLRNKIPTPSGGLNIYLSSSTSDGYRNHSQSKFYLGNINYHRKVSENSKLNLLVNYYYAPYLLNPGSLNLNDAENNPAKSRSIYKRFGTGKRVAQLISGVSFNYQKNKSAFNSVLYFSTRKLDNSIPFRIIELNRISIGLKSDYKFSLSYLSNTDVILGFDAEMQFDKRTEFVNKGFENDFPGYSELIDKLNRGNKLLYQNESVLGFGTFVKVNHNLTDRILFSFGVRYDNYIFEAEDKLLSDGSDDSGKETLSNLSPLIGLSWKLSNNTIFYSNYSEGFQTPTTNELSNRADGSGGFNPTLIPEKIKSFESGLRIHIPVYNIKVNPVFFVMNITDMILPYQNKLEETFYRNTGNARNIGFELGLEKKILENLYFTTSYSYNNFKFVDTEYNNTDMNDNFIPGVPRQIINTSLFFEPIKNHSVYLNIYYLGKQYTNDINTDDFPWNKYSTKPYLLMNLSFLSKFHLLKIPFEFHLGVNNLLDNMKAFSIIPNATGGNYYEPLPGVSLVFGLKSTIL